METCFVAKTSEVFKTSEVCSQTDSIRQQIVSRWCNGLHVLLQGFQGILGFGGFATPIADPRMMHQCGD
jgi:hypothetical protein